MLLKASEIPKILHQLQSPEEVDRVTALAQLRSVPSPRVLRHIRRVAESDSSQQVRGLAMKILEDGACRIAGEDTGRFLASDGGSSRLRDFLIDPDPTVRAQVSRCLAFNLSRRVPVLISQALRIENDPFVQSCMIISLAVSGGSAVVANLVGFLDSPSSQLRANVVQALDACEDSGLLTRILPLLEDPEPRVRGVVLDCLKTHSSREILRAIDAFLYSGSPDYSRVALIALRLFDEDTVLPRVMDHAKSDEPSVREAALAALSDLARKGSKRADVLLSRLITPAIAHTPELEDSVGVDRSPIEARLLGPYPEDRIEAVSEAIGQGRGDLKNHLVSRLQEEVDTGVQATLIAAIGSLGDRRDVQTLQPYLVSEDDRIRANAVEALGRVLDPADLFGLEGHLQDPIPRVRANAAVAVYPVNPAVALEVLHGMVASGDPDRARSAIWAASTIATPEMIPFLRQSRNHPVQEVADRAQSSLESLAAHAPVAEEGDSHETFAALEPGSIGEDPVRDVAESGRSFAPSGSFIDREFLLDDLRHEEEGVRCAAARKIAATGDPEYVSRLTELLKDPNPGVRRVARQAARDILKEACPADGLEDVHALSELERDLTLGGPAALQALEAIAHTAVRTSLKPVVRILTSRLKLEADPHMRARLVTLISIMGDRQAAQQVKDCLLDEDPRVRSNALEGLSLLMNHNELRSILVKSLRDPDLRVQVTALTATGESLIPSFMDHLETMMNSADDVYRTAGVTAIESVTFPGRWDLLKRCYDKEENPDLVDRIGRLMALDIEGGNVEEGIALLESSQSLKKSTLAKYLGRAPVDPDGAGAKESTIDIDPMSSVRKVMEFRNTRQVGKAILGELLDGEEKPVTVAYILRAAHELVSDQLLERIAKLIHSPDRRIRLALAQGIGQVDHPDTGDHLAFLIRDQDPEISEVAAAWLEKLDVARARPGIQILLEDGSAWCSRRGFELLEARGAGEGLPILLASLERSAYPALVSDAGRLLKSWGDLVTLDELTRIYRAVDPRRRPLLGQLGRRLAERLGVEDSVFQTKKSPGAGQGAGWFDPIIKTASIKDLLERRRARKEADAMSSAKLELIPVLQPGDAVVSRGSESGYPVGLAGVVACLVAVGVAVMTVDLGPAILVPAGDQTQNRPSTPVKRILRSVLTGTEFETGVSVNSTGMTEEPSGGAGLRDALEPRRITSRSIEIMFDLDEQRGDYRAVVQEARAQLDMGGGLRILLELEYALKSIDRDHVIGRFALGEALVTASRVLDRKDLHEAYSRAIRGGRADMVRALNESAEEGKITRKQADGVLLAIGARAESGESAAPGAEGP